MTFVGLVALSTLATSPSNGQQVTAEPEALGNGAAAYAYFSRVVTMDRTRKSQNDAVRPVVAWLDLTEGPVIVSALGTGRHYVLPMLDKWTGVFAPPGSRTMGTRAGDFLVALPSWQGPLPAGVARIDSPTPYAWIVGRTETDGTPGSGAARNVPAGYRVMPLSEWAKGPLPVTTEIASLVGIRLPRTQADTCPGTNAARTEPGC